MEPLYTKDFGRMARKAGMESISMALILQFITKGTGKTTWKTAKEDFCSEMGSIQVYGGMTKNMDRENWEYKGDKEL